MENHVNGVVITDTHLFEKSSRQDSLLDCNFDDVFKCFKQAIQLAIDNKLSYVFHAGDFFDSRKHQSKSLLQMAEQIFDLFSESGIKLILINGNHDMTDYSDSYSFLSPYKYHPGVTHIETFSFVDVNNTRFHFLSFFDNETYKEYLNKIKLNISNSHKNVLITHIGIHGALKNNGEKEDSAITFDLFIDFDKVLIGHYHNYSQHAGGKVVYIGSALQHNFGEDSQKGIILIDSKLKLNRIKTDFKEYRNIYVNISDMKADDIFTLIDQKNELHQKVIFSGDPVLIKALDKQKLIDAGIKFDVKSEVVSIQKIEKKIESHSTSSIETHFVEFCQENKYLKEEGESYLIKAIKK